MHKICFQGSLAEVMDMKLCENRILLKKTYIWWLPNSCMYIVCIWFNINVEYNIVKLQLDASF